MKKQVLPAEEAAKQADLSKHKDHFPNTAVPPIGTARIYALLYGTANYIIGCRRYPFRIHAASEERVFYPALLTATPALRWFALAGSHEHENLDTTLDKLLGRRPGDDEYRVIVKVARDRVEMHARDEEEGEILPLVSKEFDIAQLDRLGAEMLAEQARIRPHILRLAGMPARAA